MANNTLFTQVCLRTTDTAHSCSLLSSDFLCKDIRVLG